MALKETHFHFNDHQKFYKGKVRDVYILDNYFISIASDRISAFDHILPKAIPHKGQVLNQTALHFLNATKHIVPNWLEASPDPNVSIGKRCEPIKLEMVIRGYLAGHAWRTYRSGIRVLCGIVMPENMRENDAFPEPIITPATKADEGHDEDISKKEIFERAIVSEEEFAMLESYTRKLFAIGQQMALERGLILVDTKYEFGVYDGQIYLIDEIHTPDSSRYFYADSYQELQEAGKPQEQLSKEFVREWLIEHGFQGLEGQEMPFMPDEFVQTISNRYIQLYERITGNKFEVHDDQSISNRIEQNILKYIGRH